MRAASAVAVMVAVAATVAAAPHGRTPHRTTHRILHRRLNATDTARHSNDQSTHHKVIHHQKNTRHEVTHHSRNVPQKISTWKRITDTFTQAFLGFADDDYDRSSSSDSGSDAESVSREPQGANTNKHSHFAALASSALSQLSWARLPKLWKRKKYRKKARANKASAKKAFSKATISDNVNNNTTDEEKNIKEYREGELAVEEGVPIVQQIYKMAGQPEVLSNPLSSLREIERKVEASGRKLTFIEYVAMFEIMVLAVIAAGVFKSANLPVPIPLFAKT